jgi:TNF receptor-associated factor 3
MRGDYDRLLPWPFQQKVTFKLIDQGQGQHIVGSFRPSLQQPNGGVNVASGCPLFVPRAVLNNGEYIKEDVMFLKIMVDTTGIPSF